MFETARSFFDACETGKGWAVCKAWCHEDASFSCQADALAKVTSLQGYTEWMKGLLSPIPDGHYELTAFAADPDRRAVVAAAVVSRRKYRRGWAGLADRQEGRSRLRLRDEVRRR